MANESFKQLEDGQGIQIVAVQHESGSVKTYVSTGNEYEGLTPDDLGAGEADDPVQTVLSVECAYVDSSHEITVNDDFDGTVTFPALSMVCHELIGGRPATRPHK